MSRRHRKDRKDRHHCYPAKDKRHYEEIKVIDAESHRRWHMLVSDKTPREAVRYIAHNFMPSEIEVILLEAIR